MSFETLFLRVLRTPNPQNVNIFVVTYSRLATGSYLQFFFSVVEHLIAVRYFCDLLAGKKKISLLLTITEIILKSLHLIVSHLLAELQGDLFSSSATNTTAFLFH